MKTANSLSSSPGTALVSFNSTTPGSVNMVGNFTGLVTDQSVRTIAIQPSTHTMYAISANVSLISFQLYTVNPTTAALTPVGPGFNLSGSAKPTMSFDPVSNEIRVATHDGRNYRVSTAGVLLSHDTNFAYVSGDPNFFHVPDTTGIAYTNNFSGATTTTLFGWDDFNDSLIRIGGPNGNPSPNGGSATTINIPASPLKYHSGMGISISSATGTLYVSHDDPATGTSMGLYTRNLTTGTEMFAGNYPTNTFIQDIAVFTPVPEPVLIFGFIMAGLAGRLVSSHHRARMTACSPD